MWYLNRNKKTRQYSLHKKEGIAIFNDDYTVDMRDTKKQILYLVLKELNRINKTPELKE